MNQPTHDDPYAIPLRGNKRVYLWGDFPLEDEAWRDFLTCLHVMAPGLANLDELVQEPEPTQPC